MVTMQETLSIASVWLSLLAFAAAYRYVASSIRTDEFRQRLFALRDELFDLAAAGRIEFDHPAYRLLRATLNGYIRFAHQLGLPPILVVAWLHGRSGARYQESFEKAIATIPEAPRREMRRIEEAMQVVVAEYLLGGLPGLRPSLRRLGRWNMFWGLARLKRALLSSTSMDYSNAVAAEFGNETARGSALP